MHRGDVTADHRRFLLYSMTRLKAFILPAVAASLTFPHTCLPLRSHMLTSSLAAAVAAEGRRTSKTHQSSSVSISCSSSRAKTERREIRRGGRSSDQTRTQTAERREEGGNGNEQR